MVVNVLIDSRAVANRNCRESIDLKTFTHVTSNGKTLIRWNEIDPTNLSNAVHVIFPSRINDNSTWDGRPFSLLCLRSRISSRDADKYDEVLDVRREKDAENHSHTSNCQCAACSNCFACSLAQPAANTNWLIITCSRRASIFSSRFSEEKGKYRKKRDTRETRARHSLSCCRALTLPQLLV